MKKIVYVFCIVPVAVSFFIHSMEYSTILYDKPCISAFKAFCLKSTHIDLIKNHLKSISTQKLEDYSEIKRHFLYNPESHVVFFGQLEKQIQASRQEIASALQSNFYRRRGNELIALVSQKKGKTTTLNINNLIAQGADVNYSIWSLGTSKEIENKKYIKGLFTPLWYARKNINLVKFLLKNKALPDQAYNNKGETLFLKLTRKKNTYEKQDSIYIKNLTDTIELLKKAGALCSENLITRNSFNHHYIYQVSTSRLPNIMKTCTYIIDINACDFLRNTYLHHLVRMYVKHKDYNGKDEGCREYILKAIHTLLENNANPNCYDGLKNTPLHLAVADVEPESLIKLLLENGSDQSLKNCLKKTSLCIAQENNYAQAELELMLAT